MQSRDILGHNISILHPCRIVLQETNQEVGHYVQEKTNSALSNLKRASEEAPNESTWLNGLSLFFSLSVSLLLLLLPYLSGIMCRQLPWWQDTQTVWR